MQPFGLQSELDSEIGSSNVFTPPDSDSYTGTNGIGFHSYAKKTASNETNACTDSGTDKVEFNSFSL